MKQLHSLLLIAAAALLFAGCAQKTVLKPTAFTAQDLSGKVASGEYVQKVDNFLLVFDASSSMEDDYADRTKFGMAKTLADGINKTLPEIPVQSGIRVFGPNIPPASGYNARIYGMTNYAVAGFGSALAKVTGAAGTTPLADALNKSAEDLGAAIGSSALIVLSDGETEEQPTLAAATALKKQFGDRLCIYPVLVGDSPAGSALLEKVVQTVGCGTVSRGDQLMNADAMSAFVTNVFFKTGSKADRDSDGDGVFDSRDKCPGTPKGIKVDKDGCPEKLPETLTMDLKIEFDFDKADVKPRYHEQLSRFADFMKAYPNATTVIEAHTDNKGSAAYNLKLSQRRAESVIKYLSGKFNIDPRRLSAKGYGFSKPVADNKSADGRQRNRRVEAVISANGKK